MTKYGHQPLMTLGQCKLISSYLASYVVYAEGYLTEMKITFAGSPEQSSLPLIRSLKLSLLSNALRVSEEIE